MMTAHDAKAQEVTTRSGRGVLGLVLAGVMAAGCVGADDEELTGTTAQAVTVSSYQTSGCSTSVVLGLSKQIADEIACMSPTSLQAFSATGNIVFSSNAVLPYLDPSAKTAIQKVGASYSLQINSGFRTVAQQYLLYRWYQQGRCGITAAATPGRSNHQSGRAIDLANYSSRISAMSAQGWAHDVAGDPVHFDHLSSPDIRGMDVKAFQRLWNRNNPNDRIAEDGAYGPQTEARLKASPATGFTVGASCVQAAEVDPDTGMPMPSVGGADVVSIEGPDRVQVGAKATFAISVNNTSDTDWPETAKLVVSGGAASDLYDSATWSSPREVGAIGPAIPAHTMGVLEVTLAGPTVSEETAAAVHLDLVDGPTQLGTIALAVTVTPNDDADISNEGDDTHDESPEVNGGCNASGNAGWLMLLAPALVALRRRRRA